MATKPSLYIVYLVPRKGLSSDDMVKLFDEFPQWFRVGGCMWYVKSEENAQQLYDRLISSVKDDGIVFIVKADPSDRQGWMTETFWGWFRENFPLEGSSK